MIKISCLKRLQADWNDRKFLRSLDLESTILDWKLGPRCPQNCVEANRAIIGHSLFIMGGYVDDIAHVSKRMFTLDLKTERWTDLGEIPKTMPETHNAVVSDNHQHLFSLTGQLGPHCSPAVPDCFSYDIRSRKWSTLPPLPEARYMPVADYYQGRIYCLGGSKPDRRSPALEGWSIGVENGKATESNWKHEFDLPVGRTHTPCLILKNKLYFFGGQSGDVQPIPGDPVYACNFNGPTDTFYKTVFSLDLSTHEYTELAPMPYALSHTEYSILHIGEFIIIAGGTLDRPVTSNLILCYSLKHNTWKTIGKLPHPMKKTITATYNDWLFVATGQCAVGKEDLRPGAVVDTVWKARLNLPSESS